MKTIFNVNGDSRVINPRNGSDQFVDLLTDQQIKGIKRFLNNLITNSDVNFNTTANVGRIIFNPNEPGGSGSRIVSIYTTDEIDGQGWIFDSVGNLYYIGGGLSPVKIMLSGATGDLTILSNFNGFGDIICHNNLTSDIINSYSGGNITFNNGIALGSNTINSGNITSNGTVSAVDISSTGIIYANDVNLTSTGYLNVNNITSSVASGSYQTKIALSNEFIDTNNSSLDIVATYIGFASPAQTLSTASKYMFIKPLSTGNFEMLMNNIANKILISDWATTKISSQFIWNLNNISNQNAIILDSLTTSGNRLQIYGTPTGTKYLYYNISDELGVIDGSTSQWKITGAGDITCSSLNCGNITFSGTFNTNNITSSSTSGSYPTKIALSNEFIDINNSSLDIIATYIGFASPAQTLSTTSKYMFIKPLSTGNFEMLISNIANKILSSDWATTKISSQFIWNLNNISNQNAIILDSLTTSGNRLQIYGTAAGTKYLYYNISDELGVIDGSTSQWKITGVGDATLSLLNCGNIISTGNISGGLITGTSLSAGTGSISTTGNISGGLVSGTSLSGGSGLISTTGNISGASITGTTSLITNLINASTGTIKNLIQMDNRFIDTGTGSVDIKSTYVGFPNLSQTLTTASNYMYIKPLTTGDFEMRILNKTKFILKTDIALNAIASQIYWAWMDESNIIHASINPNTTAGTTNNAVCKFYARVVDTSLYYTRNGTLGSQNETSLIAIWRIDENGNIFTSGTVNANTINPNSGTTISSTSIWNFKNGANIPILLDPTTTSGNRLQIYGVAGGTRYLFFNTSNNIGVFNTVTSANVWSIDGTTGNINTIGTINANTINPNSGTTISSTSIWNFKNGANIPILLDPTTASGNRLQIYGVAGGTRYLFFNTSNNIGVFNTATSANVWSIDGTTGNINTIGTLTYSSLSATSFLTNSISAITTNTYINSIQMTNLFFSSGIGSMDLRAHYIGFAHPSVTLSSASKYLAIIPATDGNFTMSINNIGNRVFFSNWSLQTLTSEFTLIAQNGFISNGTQNTFNSTGTRAIYVPNGTIETQLIKVNDSLNSAISVPNGGVTAYRMIANNYIQCLGQYIYCQHNLINDIAGLWSNRTGSSGSGLNGNANNWVSMGGLENNNGMSIGYPAYNYGNTNRIFMWMIENTVSSGKALGIAINQVQAPNAYINATNQSTGFALLGFFGASYRGAAAYSFTGEHSSMVCDEEYDDLMNYNTDDFIGMIVCSSGKIYNLPYTPYGDTYTKQVDNIKSIDAQPMTRLSKKYKDKSVLGVISHIEKVGKDRNDINATSWTGCLSLDKDERRRIRVACIGEGGIWITNEYGNIENGDYITTSNIAGYSTKQDDDLMHNYTIAKATMDCSFDIEKPDDYKTKYLGDGIYASYIACTFHCG